MKNCLLGSYKMKTYLLGNGKKVELSIPEKGKINHDFFKEDVFEYKLGRNCYGQDVVFVKDRDTNRYVEDALHNFLDQMDLETAR